MAEGQVLQDTVNIRWSKDRRLPHRPSTFGPFALQQVPSTRSVKENFAVRGDLESFRHGLPCLNAFGASHIVSLSLSHEKHSRARLSCWATVLHTPSFSPAN
jgi:hypothetical protein